MDIIASFSQTLHFRHDIVGLFFLPGNLSNQVYLDLFETSGINHYRAEKLYFLTTHYQLIMRYP